MHSMPEGQNGSVCALDQMESSSVASCKSTWYFSWACIPLKVTAGGWITVIVSLPLVISPHGGDVADDDGYW